MPKKFRGPNSKVTAAREKQAELRSQRAAEEVAKAEAREAREWQQGADLRAARRAAEEEERAAERERRAAERRKLQEAEEKELSGIRPAGPGAAPPGKKKQARGKKLKHGAKGGTPAWELALQEEAPKSRAERRREALKRAEEKKKRQQEQEQQQQQQQQQTEEAAATASPAAPLTEEERKAQAAREATLRLAAMYAEEEAVEARRGTSDPIPENLNRLQSEYEQATGIDAALDLLGGGGGGGPGGGDDRHPERRMRAAHRAFEERELPRLREELPGLKLSQYRERIWEMWQRSPENPMVAKRQQQQQEQEQDPTGT